MQYKLESVIPRLRDIRSAVIPNFCHGPSSDVDHGKSVDIINVGTLEPRKNQQFLLEVLAHARRQGKIYTLALVGDGPDRSKLERFVRDMRIEKQVRFIGNRPRAVELMSSARLYAHSATIENLPLALIEAMACGLPVLAPVVGGIPELFDPGEAGLFWRLDDVQSAGELLIRLLEDTAKLQAMGLAARARFHARFDAAQVVGRLCDFLVHTDDRLAEVGAHPALTS
jgi:glycosyltransferase involved in cell wall biosynthesis